MKNDVCVNHEIMNDKMLAQEYLEGTEYVVDCVSYEGQHVACAIWQYRVITILYVD